jgi:lysophospholipase L1-like esterase
MKRIALFIFLILSVITCFAQTQIDPTYQIKWNLLSGSGAPSITCTQNGNYTVYPYGAEWGQSYQDTTNNVEYKCTTSGWVNNLPATGGTLTGALTGTSASFSGTLAAGAACPSGAPAGSVCSNGFVVTNNLPALGQIYSGSNWTNLNGFTSNGATPTITGGNFVFSGGTPSYSQTLDYNWTTDLPVWSMTETIIAGAISTNTAIGIGTRSNNWVSSYRENIVGLIDLSNDSLAGKVQLALDAGSNVTAPVATSATALTLAAGDTISLTVSRNYDIINVSAYDVTTQSAPVSTSYQWTNLTTNPYVPGNSGKFAIYYFGGTETVTSLSISSGTPTGVDILAVGDSKTLGEFAGPYWLSWSGLLQDNYRVTVDAGGAETTYDTLNRIPELIALKPKTIILCIGRNDVAFGVALGTIETNYASIVSQLQAAGITVYHLLPLFETSGVNYVPLTAWINSTYGAANTIAVPALNNAALLGADGVHPNNPGHQVIYQSVLSFIQGKLNAVNYAPFKSNQFLGLFPPSITSVEDNPAISYFPPAFPPASVPNQLSQGINLVKALPGFAAGWNLSFDASNAPWDTHYQPNSWAGWRWCDYAYGTMLTSNTQLLSGGCHMLPIPPAGSINRILSEPSYVPNMDYSPSSVVSPSVTVDGVYPGLNYSTAYPTAGYSAGVMFGVPSAWGSTPYIMHVIPDSYGGELFCTYVHASAFSSLTQATCSKHVGVNSSNQFPAGIGAINFAFGGDTSISAGPRASYYSTTGQVSSLPVGAFIGVFKVVKPGTVENIEGAAATFTCTVNPVITMYDCGTSPGSCSSPTTKGSVTITSATDFDGSVSSATLTAGHYITFGVSSGTCTSANLSISAEYRMN